MLRQILAAFLLLLPITSNLLAQPSLAPSTIGNQPVTPTQAGQLAQLPRTHGQMWQEYNIAAYTNGVPNVEKPQQAIIDWILRETGTEAWFSESVALLNADRQTVRAYHTPEIQQVVKETVDRFIRSRGESYVIGIRLVTVSSPNWRSKSYELLRPITVQTPGVEAWIISKENTAALIGDLKKRSDYQEHNSPNVIIPNGQSHSVARRRPRSYARSVRFRADALAGYDLDMGQFDEGYMLEVSPLFSLDGGTIDAVLKCDVDQVERFVPIPVDVPMPGGKRQRVQIQIPQVVSWRLHERFRWPSNQVLMLSCGVVATPGPERTSPLGISLPSLKSNPGRADALLFIECKGKAKDIVIDAQRTANIGAQPKRKL